jgi:hypothetical protein
MIRYNLSPIRFIEKIRQFYLRPLVRRDRHNYFEPLNIIEVESRLNQLGVTLEPFIVDWSKFQKFRETFSGRFGRWNKSIEKQLEYFISEVLLMPDPNDCIIDVGSWFSPYPELIRQKYGCPVYALDLSYSAGIHGWQIGGDAADMPVPDGFATKMTLHCTFEHFEGSSDTRFVHETARVLKSGGKVVIVPLYIHQRYTIWTDPSLFASKRIQPDPGAAIFRNVGWSNAFGRHYNPEAFYDRVVRACEAAGLRISILKVANVQELDPSCYVRFIGLIEKP